MDPDPALQITELLANWSKGDLHAREELMPLVYDELRRLAASYLRRERIATTLYSQPPSSTKPICAWCKRKT